MSLEKKRTQLKDNISCRTTTKLLLILVDGKEICNWIPRALLMRYVDKYYRDTVGASRLQRWGGVTPEDGAASAAR